MIPHFKEHTHIYTDKQHFEIKQASMIVQEKEPLSAEKERVQIACDLHPFSIPKKMRISPYPSSRRRVRASSWCGWEVG